VDAFRFTGETAGDDIYEAWHNHYRALRAIPALASATIVYILEGALGVHHLDVARWVGKLNNTHVLRSEPGVIGFKPDEKFRFKSDMLLRDRIGKGGVQFAETLVSVNKEPTRNAAAVREMLCDQVSNMCIYQKIRPNGSMRDFITSITDQQGKRLAGRKNDLQVALSNLLIVVEKFYGEELPIDYHIFPWLRAHRTFRIGV
jgi:hypothetical protein